jgi:hypothetical protein
VREHGISPLEFVTSRWGVGGQRIAMLRAHAYGLTGR